MVGSGGAGSTGTYGRNTSRVSKAAARGRSRAWEGSHSGHCHLPVRCRADLARGQLGTYRFGCLVPCQLQANAVAGVPLLLLHVLQVPQVTVCTG